MLVREWIGEFLNEYRAAFSPPDWPVPGSEEETIYVRLWITALATREVSRVEASRAVDRLAPTPPRWRHEHIPAVLRAVGELRPSAAAPPDSRAAAEQASRGCELCGGQGLVTLWHPQPDPERRVPKTVAGHCVCPFGRWTRGKTDPDLLPRIPDAARPGGWLFKAPAECLNHTPTRRIL